METKDKDKNTEKEEKESLDKLMKEIYEEQRRLHPEIYEPKE